MIPLGSNVQQIAIQATPAPPELQLISRQILTEQHRILPFSSATKSTDRLNKAMLESSQISESSVSSTRPLVKASEYIQLLLQQQQHPEIVTRKTPAVSSSGIYRSIFHSNTWSALSFQKELDLAN
jgi:hypothetical protein